MVWLLWKIVKANKIEGTIQQNEFHINGSAVGQEYEINFKAIENTSIEFSNYDGESQTINILEGQTSISGILQFELELITLDYSKFDTDIPIELTLYELSEAKKAYTLDESKDAPAKGDQQSAANFSDGLQAVADDLTEKLSVMRTELWHSMSFGLPLLDKVKSKALIDSAVADIVLRQPNVIGISKFSSAVNQKEYHADIEVQTALGNLTINI